MLKRLSQLIWAFRAGQAELDWDFINTSLSPAELALFNKMDPVTRYHCFRVAKTALELAAQAPPGKEHLNLQLLIKGALLHDLGKEHGDVSVWDRIIFVVVQTIFPPLGKILAKKGTGNLFSNLRHGFYVHYQHPAKGAALAKEANLQPELITLIEEHHFPPVEGEPLELRILRKADELN